MARGGLEPPTPRFSVMDGNLSNSRGIPAFEWVLAIDPHQLDVRKLRSFRVDLDTESRFGAQWALAPVTPPGGSRARAWTEGWRSERAVSRPAPREGLVGDGLSVAVLDEPPQRFHDARLRVR
jgi:hypothetical protein